MSRQTVLLVEDNVELNEINKRALEGAGYMVLTALTLSKAREHLADNEPDIILLDVILPDGDGYNFCEEIRDTTDAHILFLTSCSEHADKIRGLSIGGDDYITKPFMLEELIQRVAAVMRRRVMKNPAKEVVLTLGNLTLDITSSRAFVNDKDILLTYKEFLLLLHFARNENKYFSAEHLYERLWKQTPNNDYNAVKIQVSKIRKKLEKSDYTISAVRGKGYQFQIK